mmetsp:Transcript_29179/g.73314  ORF Transcript_29179/g.73314 Transcript_29179/m.73314 type:complete len:254 (-) Transcript_29179:377-1138(-)
MVSVLSSMPGGACAIAHLCQRSGTTTVTRIHTRHAGRVYGLPAYPSVRAAGLPSLPAPKLAIAIRNAKVAALSGFDSEQLLDMHSRQPASITTPIWDVADGLESPIQGFYLFTLLSVLVIGAFLVVRQVLVRNELEETIKVLGERKRRGEATAEDYFELGVVLVRKKLYTQATQNLRNAQKMWDGEPEELAQVHNAIGFSFFNMGKYDDSVKEYKKAVELQPGYVTAWNNLGDAFEVCNGAQTLVNIEGIATQ